MSSLQYRPDKPGNPRWLLSQLSSSLQHHMSYTCKVNKHGVIPFRRGRELDALSHALLLAANQTLSQIMYKCAMMSMRGSTNKSIPNNLPLILVHLRLTASLNQLILLFGIQYVFLPSLQQRDLKSVLHSLRAPRISKTLEGFLSYAKSCSV